jgi:hypothetical protein
MLRVPTRNQAGTRNQALSLLNSPAHLPPANQIFFSALFAARFEDSFQKIHIQSVGLSHDGKV